MFSKFAAICLLAVLGASSWATTYTSDGTLADTQSKVNSAVDGDTVVIPDGTREWTGALTVTKAITLMGNGTSVCTIQSGVPDGGSLINATLVASKVLEITGFKVTQGASGTGSYVQTIVITGAASDPTMTARFRIHHCSFIGIRAGAFLFSGCFGLVDHNDFQGYVLGQPAILGYVKGNGYYGGGAYGDASWNAADQFGTDQFVFFEDNTGNNDLYAGNLTALDCQAGGRFVFRYNTMKGMSIESHGLEAQRERSGRAFEIYNNTITGYDDRNAWIYMRGGVGLVYSNTLSGWTASPNFALLNNRAKDELAMPFGGSDGRNPWDVNDAGNPFVTGTASGSGTLTVTDSGKSWTVNQWTGYIVRKTSGKTVSTFSVAGGTVTFTSASHGFTTGDIVSVFGATQQAVNGIYSITVTGVNTFTGTNFYAVSSPTTGTIRATLGNHFSEIASNTATQLTFKDTIYASPYRCAFVSGETYEINKITHSMDMPGRTVGSLVSGDSPALPAGWNDQTTSPWYEWSNLTGASADINFSPASGTIIAGTHYNNDTVKPGYGAYTYPHPLQAGGGGGGVGTVVTPSKKKIKAQSAMRAILR